MANPVLWFEVLGKDGKALRKFYSSLFGWAIEDSDPSGEIDYGLVAASDGGIGGGIGSSPDGSGGFATFYVEVDDPDAFLAKATELGGKTILPLTEIPGFGLKYAYFADPEGHVIGISKGIARPAAK
jgi:predicted enzyme related to lactoylglutathione lyase